MGTILVDLHILVELPTPFVLVSNTKRVGRSTKISRSTKIAPIKTNSDITNYRQKVSEKSSTTCLEIPYYLYKF